MAVLKKGISSFFLPIFVALVYIFLYVPIIVLVIFSFNASSGIYNWSHFSLKWYSELFRSAEVAHALKNSLIVSFFSVFFSITFGMMAIIYGMHYRLFKSFFLFFSSMVVPEIVLAVGLLATFSFFSVPLGLNTLIVGHTLIGLSYTIPVLYNRYLELDKSYLEASLDLGATKTQTLFKVILPLMFPAIFSSAILVFVISFEDFLISFFCAGGSAQTLSLFIFAKLRAEVTPMINALSTMILIGTVILVLLISFLNSRTRK